MRARSRRSTRTSRAGPIRCSSRLAGCCRQSGAPKPSTVLAPHGVDVELFRSASDRGCRSRLAPRDLRRPVIGFFGLIEEWIDLDLIADLAERRPRWTFLMIGRLAVDPGRLTALPNVVFAGPQPYRSLPAGRRRSTWRSFRIV